MTVRPDFAIVAGISHYPDEGLGTLAGCENDARAFREWVTTKGGVAEQRVAYIVSSDFPVSANAAGAKPAEAELEHAFRRLHDAARRSLDAGTGWTIGRRLYIYLAGHGFVPSWQSQNRILALLTANAGEGSPNHVAAPLYQRWARDSAVFDEVLLFMDCCASTDYEVGVRPVPFVMPKMPGAVAKGRLFYAAACKPGFKTREKTVLRGGVKRGVFTLTLLEGLSGGAAKGSNITNFSLTSYLTEQMERHLDAADLEDEEISRQADVDFDPKTEFVLFSNIPPEMTHHTVVFRLEKGDIGQQLIVMAGMDVESQTTITAEEIALPLRTGMYVAKVGAKEVPFASPAKDDRVVV